MDERLWDLFFDNMQKLLFPEVWLLMDLSISKLELVALLLLWRTDEVTMTQLAESINIPMSTATGVVSRLAKKGFVERLTDESNRRIVTVRLTQNGKDMAESTKQTVIKYWELFTKILTDEEKEMLFKLSAKIIAMLGKGEFESTGGETEIKKIVIE